MKIGTDIGRGQSKYLRRGYRTIVTGFSSQAAAVAFCDKLKAANKPCITK